MPTEIQKEKTQASQPLLPKWANAQDGWCRAIAADVQVTLENEARMLGGTPEQVVRTITENARPLKFASQEFKKE